MFQYKNTLQRPFKIV